MGSEIQPLAVEARKSWLEKTKAFKDCAEETRRMQPAAPGAIRFKEFVVCLNDIPSPESRIQVCQGVAG